MDSQYFNFGLRIASTVAGQQAEEVLQKKASVDTVADPKTPGYGALQRMICKYAATAFEQSGKMLSFPYSVFDKLASAPQWYPEFDPYYNAAIKAIGTVHSNIRKEASHTLNDEMIKSALIPGGITSGIISGLSRVSPAALKLALATAGVTGVTGGALTWLANRGIQQDEPNVEALKQRIDYYNQLTGEIEQELSNQNAVTDRKKVKNTAGNYLI